MKGLKHFAMAEVLLLAASLPWANAQTCNDYIAEGRSLLEVSNVVDANTRFASAVALCPGNEVARFYRAVTAVAALPFRPGPSNFMDRIGLPREGRSLYSWTATPPRDTNGHLIVPPGANSSEAVAFFRNDVLPVIAAAELDLAYIASPGFALALNYEETKMADVIVDYGDVLLLRAALNALQFWGYSLSSWNLGVHLNALEQLDAADELSVQRVLRDYPQLLTFATPDDLAAAKTAFENAVARYLEASAFIRARPANLVRLFNYDLGEAQREERFRCTLVDLRDSLQAPNVLCLNSNYVIYLANYFSPNNAPRRWLPRFAGNDIEINSFPDLTFGGIIDGLSEPVVEEFVTRYVDMVSTIQNPSMPSLGRFSCEFPALPDRAYALEYSSDLKTWTKGLEFYSEGGVYAFLDGGARNAPYRFYRLVELYKFAVVKGVVRDACSLAPIPNAEVTATPYIDFPRQTVATDSQGRFTLRLFRSEYYQNIPWQYYWDISARALGYNATWHYGGDETELNLNLLPTSAPRPVNADFSGRLPLTGLPATLTSANCGTDFSPNNAPSLGHWVVWFTWTAPVSGRVAIHAERASGEISYNLPLLSVFTGTTTNNLSLVVSSAWEVRFEATAGTTYQIAVGQSYYGRPGQFTLRISSPPSLNWSAPADGTEFVALATIPFSVSPTDLDGNIVKVRYFANGEKIAELGAAPFDFVWENVPANMYELEARARDAQGLVTSEYRQVAVRPPNDHFAGRIPIEGAPLRVKGSNKAATLEPGEAGHISQSIWWRWRTPVAGDYTIVAEGADGDDRRATLLAVYTGLALNQLSLVVSNQIEDDDLPLQVSFAAQSQTDYQIVVDGYRGDEVQLRILPTAPPQVALLTPTNNARFIAPASIFVQVDATDADNNLSSVELFGNARLLQAYPGPFSFQWTNVPAGWYTLKARAIDAWGVENFSTPVAIQVRPPPPPNDDFADRIVLTESSGVLSGTTDAATKEAGEPNTGYGFSGNSVWWTWTAPANGTLILDDVLSTWYKQVHVFRGNSVSALSTVAYDVGYSTWLATFVQAGVVYQICVEGMYGHSGPVQINLQFNP